jgi:hypothetical protein
MKSIVVADSKRHAQAMIAWLKLPADRWQAVAYGDKLTEIYEHAKLVRPASGVLQAHTDWVLERLVPHVAMHGHVSTLPRNWSIPQEQVA